MMYSFLCNTSPGIHLGVESLQSINWILLKILFIKTQLIPLALASVKRANNLFSPSHKLNTLHWGFTVQQWDFIFDTKKRWIFQSGPHRGYAVACYAQWTGALYLTFHNSSWSLQLSEALVNWLGNGLWQDCLGETGVRTLQLLIFVEEQYILNFDLGNPQDLASQLVSISTFDCALFSAVCLPYCGLSKSQKP